MMYAKNAKFTSAQSHPTLVFMENCVVEIAGVDAAATYPHAFVYIRQLAIHLRSAMTTRKTVCVL
jgi:nucleolar complex protein 2